MGDRGCQRARLDSMPQSPGGVLTQRGMRSTLSPGERAGRGGDIIPRHEPTHPTPAHSSLFADLLPCKQACVRTISWLIVVLAFVGCSPMRQQNASLRPEAD